VNGRQLAFAVTYWAILAVVVWWFWTDEPPARVRLWHYTYRAAYAVARTAGRLGLDAERHYQDGMTQVRGS
jgi:hypothetical protein